ncbi:transcriptional regulator [Streptomyces sp. NPDC126497]|uniref:transcriptional regulator n=1 Tax=Streptomyces sp. NPDC126497 TaxID=3155313 RepID=UPI003322926C
MRGVTSVPVAVLLPADSPRLEGQAAEHVARLAAVETPLPPILVDRRSMRVIDGMHRLAAAFRKGEATILVEFFDGTAEEAFLRAVEANVTHGLPLSKEDRRAAAERIIASHPAMSDRAIARVAGLGAKTVAAIRRTSGGGNAQLSARIGRDGKVRPLNSAEGRERAAGLIAECPQASLREIARLAGVSPATVSDVRRRLLAGEPPVPEQAPRPAPPRDERPEPDAPEPTPPEPATPQEPRQPPRGGRLPVPDPAALLDRLLSDPSLRHREEDRRLFRVLQRNAIEERGWSKLAAAVPSHCGDLVVDLARQYAETWLEVAQELDENAE